jgi:hypothetical protein
MTFPLLLATAVLGVPVHCLPAANISGPVAGFYQPRPVQAILISERYCADVRRGTRAGAWILAHELGHAWQDANRLPLDEGQADRLAAGWWRWVQRLLGGRPEWVVRLAP